MREEAIPRLKMTDRMASTEMNDRASATLRMESSGASPDLELASIIDSILLKFQIMRWVGGLYALEEVQRFRRNVIQHAEIPG